jgi:type IV pilus assembly protein PilW
MRRLPARGLTLVELMVALAIGMIMSLAVFTVMASFESQRRTTRSGADLDQTGSIAMFMLDQWIRSAGSGLAQAVPDRSTSSGAASSYAYGCELFAAKSGTQLLPMASTMPAPFDKVLPGPTGATGVFRLAPAVILPGQTTPGASGKASDVLVLMAAGSAGGQVPALFTASAGASSLALSNTVGMTAGDLLLLADTQPASAGGQAGCLVSQVAAGFTGTTAASPVLTLPLDGTWYAGTVGAQSVTDYSSTGAAMDLGSPSSGTPPSFQVVGVGDNDTLYSYDLLNLSGAALQARADSVFELHALYGVDASGKGKLDTWVAPTGSYAPSALLDGSTTAATTLMSIKALRVGLILRTALPERGAVSGASLTLFSDLGGTLAYTRPLSSAEQHYRYRTVEATIPLRNNGF